VTRHTSKSDKKTNNKAVINHNCGKLRKREK
jgi:hypothetical protein